MKRIELFERFFKVKPQPVGDYIFDKYISSIIPDAKRVKVIDYPPSNEHQPIYVYLQPHYVSDIEFTLSSNAFSEKDLNTFLKIINTVKELCYEKVKSSKGIEYYFYDGYIRLRLILKQDKLKEIQQSQEYQNWLSSAETQWKKYREDETMKKYAKKYNL